MQSSGSILFKRPSILCAEAHREYGLAAGSSFSFANACIAVPLGFDEIPFATKHYPVLFMNNCEIVPVALMGTGNANKFVQSDGRWLPDYYIPQVLQFYPFTLEKMQGQDEGVLILDLASDRIISNAGTKVASRLFDRGGVPTNLLRDIATKGAQMYHERVKAMEMAKLLQDADVLIPSVVQFSDQTRAASDIGRLYAINAHAYRSLATETIINWFRSAWLDVIGAIFLSQQVWLRAIVQTR